MAVISITIPTDGTTADAADVGTPLTTIVNEINGQLDNTNIKSGAAIDGSKLANGSVTPSKLDLDPAAAYVATSETTTSTSFVDLTTTTDTVTVTVGANGFLLVSLYGWINNSAGNSTSVGFVLSGANTLAAADEYSLFLIGTSSTQMGATFLLTGLAAGSTVVKMKYKVSAGTGTYSRRRISVVPL